MQEIWVVEYSPTQKAIHIETLDTAMGANRRNIINGISPEYVPIYAASTHEEANAYAGVFFDHLQNNAQEPF